MSNEETIEFAKLLVQNIRDMAIKSGDVQLYSDNMRSPIAKRWRDAKYSGNADKFAEMIISDTVDDTIFYLLLAVDEGLLNISFNTSDGKKLSVEGDIIGELGGWYMGEWRTKQSTQRCFDDIV